MDRLKLENQLCFPLYACSREVLTKYKPILDEIDLTYTQYIVMLVMWEHQEISAKELGKLLHLDSGTLTPVLKTLEKKGLVARKRSTLDERVLVVNITDKGKKLKREAAEIPDRIGSCINLNQDEAETLYRLLYKVMGEIDG